MFTTFRIQITSSLPNVTIIKCIKKTVENWPNGTLVQHFLQELFWVWHQIRRPHRTIYPIGPTRAILGTYDIKQELFFLPSKKEEEFCKHTIKEKREEQKKKGNSTNYDISIFE